MKTAHRRSAALRPLPLLAWVVPVGLSVTVPSRGAHAEATAATSAPTSAATTNGSAATTSAAPGPAPSPPTVIDPPPSLAGMPGAVPPHPPAYPDVAPPITLGTAGYSGGNIYIKSANDEFTLFVGGRLQEDVYSYFGPGVSDYDRSNGTGLKAGLKSTRVRPEISARVLDKYYAFFGAEVGGSAVDATETPQSSANVADAFVGVEVDSLLDIRIGQFDTPFTMANVSSDKYFDFMERPLSVRDVGAPYNKDLGVMVRGESRNRVFNYAVALVGGGGQNRPSVDGQPDVDARIFVRPLATQTQLGALSRIRVGASMRAGSRDADFVWYSAPTLTTPGGYAFWTPAYSKGATATIIAPQGRQLGVAGELYAPLHDRVDLSAELIYVDDGRREAYYVPSGTESRFTTLRSGEFSGVSYYVQLAVWPYGTPRVNGEPGTYMLPKLRPNTGHEGEDGLEVALRGEQLILDYNSSSRSGTPDGSGLDAGTTHLRVNDVQLAVTYWATKHIRFTLQGAMYYFPGTTNPSYDRVGGTQTPPTGTVPSNQAGAPGAMRNAQGNPFDFDAHSLYEVSFRAAFAL